jgi:hypothetical protein
MYHVLCWFIILFRLLSVIVTFYSKFQTVIYRVIHKSLRDFRPLRYSSQDGHAEGEHVNKGRDTPSFCPNLHVLDMCTLGDAADVNPVIKFLRHELQKETWSVFPSVDMLPVGVTIPATVPQGSEIPEGLMNNPIYIYIYIYIYIHS